MAVNNLGGVAPQWFRNLSKSWQYISNTLLLIVGAAAMIPTPTKDLIQDLIVPIIGLVIVTASLLMAQPPEQVIQQQVKKLDKQKQKEADAVVKAANNR